MNKALHIAGGFQVDDALPFSGFRTTLREAFRMSFISLPQGFVPPGKKADIIAESALLGRDVPQA